MTLIGNSGINRQNPTSARQQDNSRQPDLPEKRLKAGTEHGLGKCEVEQVHHLVYPIDSGWFQQRTRP